ncbi:uncharacterized protein DS421_13g403560 [Arachis hypogaea]|nr:uncharacterized protein DS421_13g403560 [Arachis hypogaea]
MISTKERTLFNGARKVKIRDAKFLSIELISGQKESPKASYRDSLLSMPSSSKGGDADPYENVGEEVKMTHPKDRWDKEVDVAVMKDKLFDFCPNIQYQKIKGASRGKPHSL